MDRDVKERQPARQFGGLDPPAAAPVGRKGTLLQFDRPVVIALEVKRLARASAVSPARSKQERAPAQSAAASACRPRRSGSAAAPVRTPVIVMVPGAMGRPREAARTKTRAIPVREGGRLDEWRARSCSERSSIVRGGGVPAPASICRCGKRALGQPGLPRIVPSERLLTAAADALVRRKRRASLARASPGVTCLPVKGRADTSQSLSFGRYGFYELGFLEQRIDPCLGRCPPARRPPVPARPPARRDAAHGPAPERGAGARCGAGAGRRMTGGAPYARSASIAGFAAGARTVALADSSAYASGRRAKNAAPPRARQARMRAPASTKRPMAMTSGACRPNQ